jgi:hypothetical protein
VSGLGDVIAAKVAKWGGVDLPLERELFGTADPDGIAAAVDDWCRRHLGAGVDAYEFFFSSIGSVHGLALGDGRRVVVKVHRRRVELAYLRAMVAVQDRLATAGVPAPRQIAGPAACGTGHGIAEVLIPQSLPVDTHAPEVIRLLASELAAFVRRARPLRDALASITHPMTLAAGALYPEPHSLRFDFVATSDGAEWIDELAGRARRRLAELPGADEVVVHADWRVENMSIRDSHVVAVYDWDSVMLGDEWHAVAAAALTFPIDWGRHQVRNFPTPTEILAFVDEYSIARGQPRAGDEGTRLAASMVACLAYGARCEHADQDSPPSGDDCQRALLREYGDALLAVGLTALGE